MVNNVYQQYIDIDKWHWQMYLITKKKTMQILRDVNIPWK